MTQRYPHKLLHVIVGGQVALQGEVGTENNRKVFRVGAVDELFAHHLGADEQSVAHNKVGMNNDGADHSEGSAGGRLHFEDGLHEEVDVVGAVLGEDRSGGLEFASTECGVLVKGLIGSTWQACEHSAPKHTRAHPTSR